MNYDPFTLIGIVYSFMAFSVGTWVIWEKATRDLRREVGKQNREKKKQNRDIEGEPGRALPLSMGGKR